MIKDSNETTEIKVTIKSLESLTPYQLNEEELQDKYNRYYEKYTKIILRFDCEKELYI